MVFSRSAIKILWTRTLARARFAKQIEVQVFRGSDGFFSSFHGRNRVVRGIRVQKGILLSDREKAIFNQVPVPSVHAMEKAYFSLTCN